MKKPTITIYDNPHLNQKEKEYTPWITIIEDDHGDHIIINPRHKLTEKENIENCINFFERPYK